MLRKNKKIILIIGVALLISIGVILGSNRNIQVEPLSMEVISISGSMTNPENGGLASLLAVGFPSNTEQAIVSNDGLRSFADTNIIIIPTRKDFLRSADFSYLDPKDSEQFHFITDKSYQMLAVSPKLRQSLGQIYLQVDDDALIESTLIVDVNGINYSAHAVGEKWYAIDNFVFSEEKVIAIKTKPKLLYSYLITRSDKSLGIAAGDVEIKKKKFARSFDLKMNDHGAACITLDGPYRIDNPAINSLNKQPVSFTFSRYKNGHPIVQLDSKIVTNAYLILESGHYSLADSINFPIKLLFTLFMTSVLIFLFTNSKISRELKVTFEDIKASIGKNYFWVVIYLVWLDILVILKLGPSSIGISREFLLAFTLLPFFIYAKFSIFSLVTFGLLCLESSYLLDLIGLKSRLLFDIVFLVFIFLVVNLVGSAILSKIMSYLKINNTDR